MIAALTCGAIVSIFGIAANNLTEYRGDWFIFWFVAKAPITALYRDLEAYPFVYPPTALFLVKPFGLLPVWTSFALWSVTGLALITIAARQIVTWWVIAVAVLMPGILSCLFAGQTSLFVGALIIWGVVARRSYGWGVAAVLKPQSIVAFPIALVARRDWHSLALVILVGATPIALAIAVWGVEPWLDWLYALDDWRTQLVRRRINELDVGMNGLALWLGLPKAIYFLGLILGIGSTWATFRESDERLEQYAALACGSVLISPYTLGYDLAGLSIVATALLFDEKRSVLTWLASGLIVAGVTANFGILLFANVLLWENRRAFCQRPSNGPQSHA